MPYAVCVQEQPKRPAPRWSRWANPLAKAVMQRLDFLALLDRQQRREFLPRIAAVLGSRLSADWTAADVQAMLERYAGVHSLLGPGEAHSPLRYLAALLDRALTNPAAQLPAHSPIRAQLHRAAPAVAVTERAQARETADREQQAARAVAAAASTDGLQRHAERARAGRRRPWSAPAPPAAADELAWPEVAEPGAASALYER